MSFHFSFRNSPHFVERLWDLWCIASVVGIWPRFIEPNLLVTSYHTLPISTLPEELHGMTIVQISDLHFSSHTSSTFLNRISDHIKKLNPDLLLFTGDLISYSELEDKERLQEFLSSLNAPLGCFSIFGNHDYSQYVSLGDDGSYRLISDHVPPLLKGFHRLFSSKKNDSSDDPKVTHAIPLHPELSTLFEKGGFEVLHNKTVQVGTGSSRLNITGLGDIMAGCCCPHEAFYAVDPRFPSIVLSHNPDSYPYFASYPGDLVLFGHTHGGQVNLPYIWKKVTPLKNRALKSGLVQQDNRFLYINRGLGSTFPFRWFAPPEITKFTLVRSGLVGNRHFAPLFFEEKIPEIA